MCDLESRYYPIQWTRSETYIAVGLHWQRKHTFWRAQRTGWCRTTIIKPEPIVTVPAHTVTRSFAIRFSRGEFRVIQGVVVDPPEVTLLVFVAQTGKGWKTNCRREKASSNCENIYVNQEGFFCINPLKWRESFTYPCPGLMITSVVWFSYLTSKRQQQLKTRRKNYLNIPLLT